MFKIRDSKAFDLSQGNNEFDFGCGNNRVFGYIGVDIMENKNAHILCDKEGWSNFHDDCATEIYSCHFIEHLDYPDVIDIFKLWRRMLISGGKLVIIFPDLAKVNPKLEPKSALNFAYAERWDEYDVHKSFWSAWLMKEFLKNAGFADIKEITGVKPGTHATEKELNWNTHIEAINP